MIVTYHANTEYSQEHARACRHPIAIDTDYVTLADTFGDPIPSIDEGKTRVEWQVTLDIAGSPVHVTIYDWKMESVPLIDLTVWECWTDQPTIAGLLQELLEPPHTKIVFCMICTEQAERYYEDDKGFPHNLCNNCAEAFELGTTYPGAVAHYL